MEEKLRNLSQNIANNTGEEHQPKHHHPEDDAPKEEEHHEEEPREEEPREEEHHEEEISDYTPEPESEEHQDDSEKARPETVSRNPHEDFEENEPRDDGSERTGSKDERFGDEATEEPKILTMDTEEEPQESPTRTKKYSPEVEAALNRLNTEDASVDLSEPLSTEPKKKGHGAHIFLFILFLLAVAAVTLCILVEQKIIDNPFPDLFKKQESSKVEPATPSQPVSADYLEIPEWGIKIEKPAGQNIVRYTVIDEFDLQIDLGTADSTTGAIHIHRDFEPTYSFSVDSSSAQEPVTSLSGYYYFIGLTGGATSSLKSYIAKEHLILAL